MGCLDPEGAARLALAEFLLRPRGEDLFREFSFADAFRNLLSRDPVALRTLRADLPLAHRRMPARREGPTRVGILVDNGLRYVQQVKAYAEAFRGQGLETRLIPYLGYDPADRTCLAWELLADPPDLIFHMNTARRELAEYLPPGLPNLCYVQDLPYAGIEDGDPLNSLTYFCVPEWRDRYAGVVGPARARFLAPATELDRHFVPGEPDYACDVAYMGTFPNPHATRASPQLELTEEVYRILRRTGEHAWERGTAERHLAEAERTLGVRMEAGREAFLKHIQVAVTRFAQRKTLVDAVLETGCTLRLYGQGWEILPAYRPHVRKSLAHGPELAEGYRTARINLHVGALAIHWRTFECIAAGGFLLIEAGKTDFRPGGLNDFLEVGKEAITFDGMEDLKGKIAHYLAHPEERRRVIEAGRARVLAEHTFLKRMRSVAEDIRARAWEIPPGR